MQLVKPEKTMTNKVELIITLKEKKEFVLFGTDEFHNMYKELNAVISKYYGDHVQGVSMTPNFVYKR